MTKDEILDGYLNVAQFGASVYGVEAAAQRYFSVSAKDLDYLQAATIAGITKSPTRVRPRAQPGGRRRSAATSCWALMLREGDITPGAVRRGRGHPDRGHAQHRPDEARLRDAPTAAVPGLGVLLRLRHQDHGPGPGVRRDRDGAPRPAVPRRPDHPHDARPVQADARADAAVKDAVPPSDPSGVAVAMSVVEPGTGKILAMAQDTVLRHGAEPPRRAHRRQLQHRQGLRRLERLPAGLDVQAVHAARVAQGGPRRCARSSTARRKTYKRTSSTARCTGLGGADWKLRNSEGGAGLHDRRSTPPRTRSTTRSPTWRRSSTCARSSRAPQDLGVHTGPAGNPLQVLPSNIIGTDDDRPADDGRRVRCVLGRRHVLRAHRDHGGRGPRRQARSPCRTPTAARRISPQLAARPSPTP